MKKKIIIVVAILFIIAAIVVGIYFINKSKQIELRKNFLVGTESPYAEYFRDVICVRNMDGTFEYVTEEGKAILQIEADDASNIKVTNQRACIWS